MQERPTLLRIVPALSALSLAHRLATPPLIADALADKHPDRDAVIEAAERLLQ